MMYAPLPSVTTVRVKPVSVCVTITVTPGSTAPLSSLTVPAIWAVACAHAALARRTLAPATHNARTSRVIIASRGGGLRADATPADDGMQKEENSQLPT